MKAPRGRRETNEQPARGGRARTLVKAHLGWLSGYPEGASPLRFRLLTGEEVAVDGNTLSRATRTVRELAREDAREIGRALGGHGGGIDVALAVLEALKPSVHGGRLAGAPVALARVLAARDIAYAQAIVERAPSLAPIVDAVMWTVALHPDRARSALRIVEGWAADLARSDDLLTAVRLVALAMELGPSKVAPLVAVMFDPRTSRVATHGGTDPKSVTLPAAMQKLVAWLTENVPLAPTALRVFAALDVPTALREWERYWTKYVPLESAPLKKRLEAEVPYSSPGGATFDLVTWYGRADATFSRRAMEVLTTLEGAGERRFFLERYRRCLVYGQRPALAAMTAAARYFSETASLGGKRLLPWADALRAFRLGNGWSTFEDELLGQQRSSASIAHVYALLRRLVSAHDTRAVSHTTLHWLIQFSEVANDDLVLAIASYAGTSIGWLNMVRGDLARMVELAEGREAPLREMLSTTRKFNDDRAVLSRMLELLVPLARAGHAGHARAIFMSLTSRMAHAVRVFGKRKVTLLVPSSREEPWMAELPPRLRAAAAELASVDSAARVTVRRLLGDTFRTKEAIDVELAAASQQVQAATGVRKERLTRRIANLRRRRQEPIKLSKQRESNLETKVERATRKAIVSALEAEADATFRTFVEEMLGEEVITPALLAPERRKYIVAIRALDPPMRALAARVLRARAGPPPWDLRDAPENQRFLRRLRQAGIDTEPWLGRGVVRKRAANGDELVLELEEDPFSIMEMGAHFDTCLSPEGVNYFSVFSNIADVNKRVVYARDAQRRIVARALLGLTEAGAIVTFNPYAHSGDIKFPDLLRDYVRDLATAMNSVVVPRGDVPRLLAPDWYDDGPHDLTGRFEFLAHASPFRKAVPTMDVATFFAEVTKHLDGTQLNELTLPLLFEVHEVTQNPDVLVALLEKLCRMPRLPAWVLVVAARYAAQAKQAGAFARELLPRVEEHVLMTFKRNHWLDVGAIRVFVEIEPTRALSILRKTRARGVRSVEDERLQDRLLLWADALERLGRSGQAQKVRARTKKPT